MSKLKIFFLGLLGGVFLLLGLFKNNISYGYIAIGTWFAALVYYMLFQKYKEITSLLLGLAILHAGVILILIEKISNPKLLGLLIFSAGIIVVMGSGFSDYMKTRKAR